MSEKSNGNRTYFDDSTVAIGTIATVIMLVTIAAVIIFG